ncbi:MAG: YraN family protein [Alistipes sp.]|jgi:putative endonuclease|nr:YraN family protein [Alistipes sp.]
MGRTQIIGHAGEQAASKWLRDNGFELLAHNWRNGPYELDIVARRGDTLHFVEVKTRDTASWESPEDAMTAAKRRSFTRAAEAWLAENPTDLECQLDLIAIDNQQNNKDNDQDNSLIIRYIPEAVLPRW